MKRQHLMYSKAAQTVIDTYLRDHFTEEETETLSASVKEQYLSFLSELPDLGGRKNRQAQSVYDCIALFALYEIVPKKPTLEIFEHMVSQLFVVPYEKLSFVNLNSPLLQKAAAGIFCHLAKIGQKHADRWTGNYHMYAEPYDRENGVHFHFTTCPIADFARKHGYCHLMPAMCNPDYPAMAAIHAALIRTKTCAEDDCCDYWILGDQDPKVREHPQYRDASGFLRNK